ncbi:uncharacterized protein PGTG_06416 [Puccinia graminis f. sp. tritici CRL 75-36-700-3]|uniref:Uncharacterized protein n=1 Tax=Puccinia graminis f. sp. tritici (strain CRL 75-36-700-3 / race SCCL) TaxID=418459 RepID=E3K7E0_PUCGT|nr:uncharacterized protein PGTG_06416 [Puccinia graminis f. sp. tritici CRL 75-36-700-3]EFP80460.1 hypothetical protein PGTG_06416 [Puccinia graminis f. sp. tritici CRL 75-36-700-3]
MSTFYIPVRFVNEPQSPYSLQSEASTHLPSSPDPEETLPNPLIKLEEPDSQPTPVAEALVSGGTASPATSTAEASASEETIESSVPDPVVKSEETDSHAASAAGLPEPEEPVDVRRRVEDHVHAPRPPPPSFSDIRLFAIAAAFQADSNGLFPFHYQERYARSPSPPRSTDYTGSGSASSPIRVDTPPPAEPCYVYPSHPDPDVELTPEERGPIWAEVVQEDAVLNARRHIKDLFRSYFNLLDGDVLNHPRRSGGYRRMARCRLYESIMEELDRVLETVDQVQMTVIE